MDEELSILELEMAMKEKELASSSQATPATQSTTQARGPGDLPGTGLTSHLFNGFRNPALAVASSSPSINPFNASVPNNPSLQRGGLTQQQEQDVNTVLGGAAEIGASFYAPGMLTGLNRLRKGKGFMKAAASLTGDTAVGAAGSFGARQGLQGLGLYEDTPLTEDLQEAYREFENGILIGGPLKVALGLGGKVANKMTSPEATFRSIANAKGAKPITGSESKIDYGRHMRWLLNNRTDFVSDVAEKSNPRAQALSLRRMKTRTGRSIEKFYSQYGDNIQVQYDDILEHPAMKEALSESQNFTRGSTKEQLFSSLQDMPQEFKAAMAGSPELTTEFKEKLLRGIDETFTGQPNVSLKKIWQLRGDLDDAIQASVHNRADEAVQKSARRFGKMVTAIRDSIDITVQKGVASGEIPAEAAEEFFKNKQAYHHITPIYHAVSRSAGGEAGKIPGINTPLSLTDMFKGAGAVGIYYAGGPVALGGLALMEAAGTSRGRALAQKSLAPIGAMYRNAPRAAIGGISGASGFRPIKSQPVDFQKAGERVSQALQRVHDLGTTLKGEQ